MLSRFPSFLQPLKCQLWSAMLTVDELGRRSRMHPETLAFCGESGVTASSQLYYTWVRPVSEASNSEMYLLVFIAARMVGRKGGHMVQGVNRLHERQTELFLQVLFIPLQKGSKLKASASGFTVSFFIITSLHLTCSFMGFPPSLHPFLRD